MPRQHGGTSQIEVTRRFLGLGYLVDPLVLVLHKFLESVAIILVLLLRLGVHEARRLVQRDDVDLPQSLRPQYR